jgi:tRNA G18 (ribose-2'-O)-methylase SpoU
LGAEDHGLTAQAIDKSHFVVRFKSELSLNVSVAGSIVMYDRGINKPRS